MNIRRTLPLLLVAAAAAIVAGAGPARANGWPTSIVGTWNVHANLATLRLQIASQASGKGCVAIGGTITDLAENVPKTIQGFYCPQSGQVSFLRQLPQTTTTFQVYTGNLSQNATTLYMGGTFVQDAPRQPRRVRVPGPEHLPGSQ